MAETEEKSDPPPAYVEPDAATPDGTTDVVPINKERPDSAWNEPAPVRDPQRLNTHLQVQKSSILPNMNYCSCIRLNGMISLESQMASRPWIVPGTYPRNAIL